MPGSQCLVFPIDPVLGQRAERFIMRFLVSRAFLAIVIVVIAGPTRASEIAEVGSRIDCAALPDSLLPVPPLVAEQCKRSHHIQQSGRGPTATGYALDMNPGQVMVSFTLNDFANRDTLGPNLLNMFGMDFDAAANTLYAIDEDTRQLGAVSLATGSFTTIGPCSPLVGDNWTGLTIDRNDIAWASSANGANAQLYTVDLTTGTATLGPTVPNLPFLIDIAIDRNGVLWGHDISTDAIYTIDTTTGAETLIGPTGHDANYSQGMDFDFDDGTLYIFLFDGYGTVYGTVDLTSGAVTAIDTSANGEFEGAIQVAADETLGCGRGSVTFDDGIPLTFTVNDQTSNGVVWVSTSDPACPTGNLAGTGEAACVDSQAAGPLAYNTELVSNLFDLTAASWASLSGRIYYDDLSTGFDTLAIDIFNGLTWDNLLLLDEDHPGEDFELDLAAYTGLTGLQVRFSYSGDGNDRFVVVDDVSIYCDMPAISLTKTVGTIPGLCAVSEEITVASGTAVTYCYQVTNTGNIDFTLSDLDDDQLGNLFAGSAILLNPGDTAQHLETAVIVSTSTNIGAWTAYQRSGPSATAFSNPATVNVSGQAPLECNSAIIGFGAGIPPDWTVEDDQGDGLVWTATGFSGYPTDCGVDNFTGGSGLAACASSDALQFVTYDTRLIAPAIDLSNWSVVNLHYLANYQNIDDLFDLDISLDGGSVWSNVLSWNSDHGSHGTYPGEAVDIDLSALASGQPNVLIRWRYYNLDANPWDWYAEIDNVSLECSRPEISLTKTLGTDPGVCATSDEIMVSPGTDVTYCYEVENTGDTAFTLSDLDDDQLGNLFTGSAIPLYPGATYQHLQTVNISRTTTNIATWTASGGADGATASAVSNPATVMMDPTEVFADGFESADTSAWSATFP